MHRRPHPAELTQQTLALIMAGGRGSRLGELTRWEAKPALPFGGQYRNIDFALSNCVNSGLRRVGILTQYMAHSLIQHVQRGWSFLAPETGGFIELWPAQQRRGTGWYSGTADAVHQNIDLIERHLPERVLVLAGDHVYRMDYGPMLAAHVANAADVTVGCIEVPVERASDCGVLAIDANGWVQRFEEKPDDPAPMPHAPDTALASMGIYVFERAFLVACLEADAADRGSSHDFGHDVLPGLIGRRRVLSYALRDARGGRGYWRDVGTLESYWQAHMDLVGELPGIDLDDPAWPIRTAPPCSPPPRFVGEGSARRSIVSAGCQVAGNVERSVLSTGACVHAGAHVSHSVVLPGAQIGRDCRIRRAVVDSDCVIPDGTVIGDDLLTSAETYHVSPAGVVLVTADTVEGTGKRGRRVA